MMSKNKCPNDPAGNHEWFDVGADFPNESQDICVLCGASKPPKNGETRSYSNNKTVFSNVVLVMDGE